MNTLENGSLLLLSGKAGSGKSTAAEILTKAYPDKYVNLALADKVKELTFKLLKIFNVKINSIQDLDDRKTKEKYRKYMQLIATEAVRSTFGNDFWCEQLMPEIVKYTKLGKIVIISDVRFPNEQDYFKTRFNNVKCILIHRPEAENVKLTHSSEDITKLTFDEEIINDKSLDDFKNEILHHHESTINNDSLIEDENKGDDLLIEEGLIMEPIEEPVMERAVPISIDESEYVNKSNTAAEDEKFISMMTTKNDKNSSQQLGVIGEHYVLELLQQLKPRNETILVSTMPHVADLHSIDYINNIFWVIEVKNKSNLTPEDVDKFKRDLVRMTEQHANDKLKCVGLFLSLRSTSIPKIGDLYVSNNEIYLSKTYFTPETVKIVFNFVEQYQLLMKPSINNPVNIIEKPLINAQELELLSLLNTEYQHLTRDLELYNSMRENCTDNLQHIAELTASANMKRRLIYCLNRQLNMEATEIIDESTEDIQYNAFIEYVKNQTNKSNIKKTVILQRYPALMNAINRIGWNEYRDQVWNTAHNNNDKSLDNNKLLDNNKSLDNNKLLDENKDVSELLDNENILIDDGLLTYVKNNITDKKKLLKTDIIKRYPTTKREITKIGWNKYRELLWNKSQNQQ